MGIVQVAKVRILAVVVVMIEIIECGQHRILNSTGVRLLERRATTERSKLGRRLVQRVVTAMAGDRSSHITQRARRARRGTEHIADERWLTVPADRIDRTEQVSCFQQERERERRQFEIRKLEFSTCLFECLAVLNYPVAESSE